MQWNQQTRSDTRQGVLTKTQEDHDRNVSIGEDEYTVDKEYLCKGDVDLGD